MIVVSRGVLAAQIITATASAALFATSVANAQESSGFALEEVIVTAQKRAQNLQDVGISVTALDQQAMDRAGITDISRIDLVTPGMNYGFIGSDAKVAIRGANSNNTFGDNSSIAGFFLDGVYRPRASQQSQAYFDVERVEVLKGPQGTLYGRNTFAGAINVYTNAPDTEALGIGIKGGYERYNRYSTEGFVNVPVNDDAAVRLAFNTKDSDGYIDNDGAGDDLGQDEARNMRLSGLWSTDTTDAVLRYSYVSQKGVPDGIFSAEGICQPINEAGITDAFGSLENCENPYPENSGNSKFDDPWKASTDVDADRNNEEQNVTLDIKTEFGEATSARYITSWTDWDSEFDWDGDWSNQEGYVFYWDEQTTSITHELQFLYEADKFKATLGGYYSVDDISFGFSQYRVAPFSFSDFADWQEIETRTTGVFFQGEYWINDAWRLIGGIRYSEEDKDTDTYSGSSSDINGDPLPGVNPDGLSGRPRGIYRYTLIPERSANQNFDDTTYRAGVEWDWRDEVMFYASYSSGFLSGGVNADGSAFEQQESDAYELGMKSRWFGDTLQANVAVYYNDYTNLTTQELVDVGGGVFQTRTVNGGEIETYGAELDITWIPTDEWIVSAGVSYMDSEYSEFGAANPFVQARGVDETFLQLDDDTPPWAPTLTLSMSVGYDFDLGDKGRLTPFLQFYYSDDYNTDDVTTYAQQEQDSYTKTDLRVIWNSPRESFQVEAFVENMEDEEVLARTNVGGFDLVQTSYLYPRNYGLRASYRF